MAVIYSPTQAVTMDTAQYLFRVYRRPITHTKTDRLEGHGEVWHRSYELNHDDHLFSMPPTTAAIMDTANRLAYATSLLCVGDAIPFIAIFLVEPGKGIDRLTPVTVLTPWHSRELRNLHDDRAQSRATMPADAPPFAPGLYSTLHWDDPSYYTFESFDLIPTGRLPIIADAFIPLDVVRATERGRNRHQWFFNTLMDGDYYWNNKGELFLTSFGSCSLARFPWFQATLELMQWTHSGYDVNETGHLILGNLALTERIANAAIDAAQRRRMFLRRPEPIQRVLQAWWQTMNSLSHGLRGQEVAGWASPAGLPVSDPQGGFVYFTQVPTEHLAFCLGAVMNFLNVLWIATGSNSLALWPRSIQVVSEQAEFNFLHQWIFGIGPTPGAVVPHVIEYDDSPTHDIALAMQDLAASIMAKLLRYWEGAFQVPHINPGTISPMALIRALQFAVNANEFAEQYETIQGDLHAIFGLMASWQFCFKPEEESRLSGPSTLYKTKREHEAIYCDFDRYEKAAESLAGMVDMSGRINDEHPVFAPPRVWEVTIINPDVANQYNEAVQARQRAELEAARQAEKARQDAMKAARRERLQRQLEAIRNEQPGGRWNPNDPWDWHNWSNPHWWVTPIAADDVPEFLANAYNHPEAIDYAEDVFNLSPKVAGGLRRLEPLINLVQNMTQPHRVLRRVFRNLTWKKFGKISRYTAKHYVKYTEDDAADGWVKERLDTDDDLWEPRDLWPEDEPMPNYPQVPQAVPVHDPPPFRSTTPGSGGGGSGGGGADVTWDEEHVEPYNPDDDS